jgi:hypothetical protein
VYVRWAGAGGARLVRLETMWLFDAGGRVAQVLRSSGQTLVKQYGSNTGSTVVKEWSNTGQTWVE